MAKRRTKWTRKKRGPKKDWKVALNEIYTSVGKPAALSSSPARLLQELKLRYDIKNVSSKQIEGWLAGKYSHSVHKNIRIHFTRNPIIAPDIDYQWQGDLLFLSELAHFNKGYKVGLVIIDVVSRFAWGELMKNKSGPSTLQAFQSILSRAYPRAPVKLQTDKGTEFLNKNFQAMLKDNNIIFFTTESDKKAAIAERFIQTLKKMIYKYLAENNTKKYYDKFQDLIDTYNKTIHSTIKFAPADVTRKNLSEVMNNLYGFLWKSDAVIEQKNKFKPGDFVRISKLHTNIFRKSYKGNWSNEIFKIFQIKNAFGQVTYGIQDLSGKEIMGSFYEAELQKIPETDAEHHYWKIEKIIKTKTIDAKKQFFVKWKDFDDSHNSWVSAEKMKSSLS
jgi:transposase InsO family protein